MNQKTDNMYQGVLLIQRPPVVKHLAAAVSLLREEWVSPHLFVAHPLEPLLTLAVLGIFDVLACVQEGPAPKAPIHIAPVGRVAGELDDGQPAVQLLLPFPAAVLPAGLPLAACRFLRIHQERRDLSLNRWFNFLNLSIMSNVHPCGTSSVFLLPRVSHGCDWLSPERRRRAAAHQRFG